MALPSERPNSVKASPNKEFFVSMLTRDIELEDAILDLIDNSLDGVIRVKSKAGEATSDLSGYWVRLNLSQNNFCVQDNCGGIPTDIAIDSAFRMGRDPQHGKEEGAIGVYGIGLKRAIFKMGRHAVVTTVNENESLRVTINSAWFTRPDDWDFPLEYPENLNDELGTSISVTSLLPDVAKQFSPSNSFVDDLRATIAQKYSLLIRRGFAVLVNDKEITPANVNFIAANLYKDDDQESIQPYFYSVNIDGVDVVIVAGFYSNVAEEEDTLAENKAEFSADLAGWTIACNDRIVVYKDKTKLTGWGEAGVPVFHTQFNAFSGIVLMYANDPLALPITTTKRGLDTSSNVYLTIKEQMRQATRIFTNFTNKWKVDPVGRREVLQSTRPYSLDAVITALAPKSEERHSRGQTYRHHTPQLPFPPSARKTDITTISFSKPKKDVEHLKSLIYDDTSVPNSQLGSDLFDKSLATHLGEQ